MTASMHPTPRQQDREPALRVVRRPAPVTDLDKVRADRLLAAKQRREAARSRDLTALLRGRPDLQGVHAPADLAVDAVRWSV